MEVSTSTGGGAVVDQLAGSVSLGGELAARPVAGSDNPATFDQAVRGLRCTGASVDMRDLVELIVEHGTEEGALLSTYEQLINDAPDESVKYLLDLILEDERRHHRLLAELSNAMAWGSTAPTPTSSVPRLPGALSGALLAQTRRLLASEEHDARALRSLRRRLRPFADTTLWALIIDLMLLDTQKHATILRFLEQRPKKD